ncbi:MAG: hemerythrin domain-containing protein [Acidobacteria bacterium]|nr:hemerythrin domain-containing protein [Acidobacteriota bacterium]
MSQIGTEVRQINVGVAPPSFLSLLKTHQRLDELFLSHQEALLMLDVGLALERLLEFERELLVHMRYEEDWLLPVYERAGRIPGGQVEFFTGEHKKMLLFLTRFKEALRQLETNPPDLMRQIIKLFDDQALFKHLVEHHDLREQNILYPTLDQVTDEDERRELLSRVE